MVYAEKRNFNNVDHLKMGRDFYGDELQRTAGLAVDVLWAAILGQCEGSSGPCDSRSGLAWECGRTAYAEFNSYLSALVNRPRLLCRDCAEEHHAHWDEMWSHVEY